MGKKAKITNNQAVQLIGAKGWARKQTTEPTINQ
jgi:hypothetical protein